MFGNLLQGKGKEMLGLLKFPRQRMLINATQPAFSLLPAHGRHTQIPADTGVDLEEDDTLCACLDWNSFGVIGKPVL